MKTKLLLLATSMLGCARVAVPCAPAPSGPVGSHAAAPLTMRDPALLRLVSEGVQIESGPAPGAYLRLSFRNLWTSGSLWINHAAQTPSRTEHETDIALDVTDAAGQRIPPSCTSRPAPPGPPDYFELAPMSDISWLTTLACYKLAAGTYSVAARYRDLSEHPPRPPIGAWWFAGEAVAETIHITIDEQGRLVDARPNATSPSAVAPTGM